MRKILLLEVQIVCFMIAIIAISYILINQNKLSNSLPGAENANIEAGAEAQEVQNFQFDENIIPVDTTVLKSGVQTTQRSNYVKLDRLHIDGGISEGNKENETQNLDNGFWRYPDNSTPDKEGTSIFFGHRRAHLPPETNTFYNLDKVKIGDQIEVGYNKKIYYYKVIDTKVVDSRDWKALQNEGFNSIKLVTCTPLGSSSHRIVVTAKAI